MSRTPMLAVGLAAALAFGATAAQAQSGNSMSQPSSTAQPSMNKNSDMNKKASKADQHFLTEAMQGDCRALAGMVLTWLRPNRIAALHPNIKPMFEALRTKLSTWAFDKTAPPASIDQLMALVSDGLALVDYNFSVLRDSGGDLQEYSLLLISLRLYHLLWPTETPARRASTAQIKR